MNAAQAIEHTLEKIRTTPVDGWPFAHLIIDGIFPDEYYKDIQDNWPEQKYFEKLSSTYADRYVIDIEETGRVCMDYRIKNKQQLAFWREHRKYYHGEQFCTLLLEKFKNQLAGSETSDAYPVSRLSLDKRGYSIPPHRDREDKLISLIFFIADEVDEEIADLCGTCLLTLENPDLEISDKHYAFNDDFKIVKRARYIPNSFLSWAVTDDSFHGVELLDKDIDRKTIGYFVKIPTPNFPRQRMSFKARLENIRAKLS